MAELQEILENDWAALVAAIDTSPSPLALPVSRRMPLSPVALFAQLEEVREAWVELRAQVRP